MAGVDIQALKGAYSGRRAFIVGNGPSLGRMPLDRLVGEYTFATGRIALLFPQTAWRPSFYVAFATSVNDYKGFPEYARDAYEAMRTAKITFAYQDCTNNPMFYMAGSTIFLHASEAGHIEPEDAAPEIWSDDVADRVSKYGTSLFSAAQIAVYMGFNPIYFIGADLGDGHFTGEYIPDHYREHRISQERVQPAIIRSHEITRMNGERLGVEFYNAGLGGSLEVYWRVDFEKLFDAPTEIDKGITNKHVSIEWLKMVSSD